VIPGTAATLTGATYVYGVVPARTVLPADASGIGEPGADLGLVRHGPVAAVVSAVSAGGALGTRRDLLQHSRLLDAIARTTAVLPLRFGAVLADRRAVVDELLAPRQARFAAALAALEGRAQFTVKARYVEETVLREVVEQEPLIAELRERLRGRPDEATWYERIQLGELVAGAVARRREADSAALVGELGRWASSVTWRPAETEDGVVDAALLVERVAWPSLERGVEGIAERQARRMRLRLLGPLAPYDFSNELMEEN
jgi:hypothetical protein